MREILARISNWFMQHKAWAATGFIVLFGFGIISFTSLLSREGFPSIQFPLVVVNGGYFVDDRGEVDRQITEPISLALLELEEVSDIQASANDNSFNVTVFFEESTTPESGLELVEQTISELELPEQAQLNFVPIDPSGFLFEYSALVAVFDPERELSLAELESESDIFIVALKDRSEIVEAEVVSPFRSGVNPLTGQSQQEQVRFSRVGVENSDGLDFYSNIIIGVNSSDEADVLELSSALHDVLDETNSQSSAEAVVGADFATQLENNISSLQSNLLTGVLAVALMSLLLISWRSSAVTGLFIVSVIVTTFAVMFAINYTINTITLFALVLALGLFVDDATIIVEAIDAEKRKQHGNSKPATILQEAIKKVGLASLAGTLTTVFVFLPLAFVSGVLGEFIRVLPITVVIALLVSYVLSLTFIPFASRFTIFTKSGGKIGWLEIVSEAVKRIGYRLADFIRGASNWVAGGLIVFSLAMVMLSGVFVNRAGFNIFPSSRDANQLVVEINFLPNTTIAEAEEVAEDINSVLAMPEFDQHITGVLYGGFNGATNQRADATIDLVPYTDRDTTAPQIVTDLQPALENAVDERALVSVGQIDAGPPAVDFPFQMQVFGEQSQTEPFAEIVSGFLADTTLNLPTGERVNVVETKIQFTDSITRSQGREFVQIAAAFDGEQTSAILEAAKTEVQDFIASQDLDQFGLTSSDVAFDFGQESENAESFAALGLVFPIAIGAMAILLGIQFRSFVQPLLIFLAIPFGFTGAFIALDITNNPLSFFSAIGLIGLTGIAVNNSILLVDYANQERANGKTPREAIAAATRQRFRPLIATTLTTVTALLPLAVYDPFWQPLAVAIIGGLLSSTLLIVVSFPYYYLLTEKARVWVSMWWRKQIRRA